MTFPVVCHCGQKIETACRELQCPACGATLLIAGNPPAQAGLFTCEVDDGGERALDFSADAFDPRPRPRR